MRHQRECEKRDDEGMAHTHMLALRMDILIIGGGIAGLTLALALEQVGLRARVYEAAPAIKRLGVGINLLPHAMRELTELGLADHLVQAGVKTREMGFYNRFGQFIYKEPRGQFAGYEWPQVSIHRGDLHRVLLDGVQDRLGDDAVQLGHRATGFTQDHDGVSVHFADRPAVRGSIAIACDGLHSPLRKQLYPDEGEPKFQGTNMWRGVTQWKPYLTGASMVQIGWLDVGKIVIYPIKAALDAQGRQSINWTAEIRRSASVMADWNLGGKLEDFLPTFASFRFDWLDCAGMIRNADLILEYPMVDRDPLPRWTHGRVTLVGDAAHPMYPRGANGAGQGILDARTLAGCLAREPDPLAALTAYEVARREAANSVVLASRNTPPDTILQVVHERSGDKPFDRIEDIVTSEELAAINEKYKRVAGFSREALKERESLIDRK